MSAKVFSCLLLSLFVGIALAEESPDTAPAKNSTAGVELDVSPGYEDAKSYVGENPTNIDVDLNTSFPQPNAVFDTRIPKEWFNWKQQLYKDHGVKLGFSYQSLYQKASDSLTGNDTAWGSWMLLEAKWDAINRGRDFEGSLVATLDWRTSIGNNFDPAAFQFATGSLWPSDFAYIDWGLWVPALYWEQWFKKDVFVFRLGQQVAPQFIDFFRFKDPRTSFSSGPFTTAPTSVPTPPPGLGLSFRWLPIDKSESYIVGTINDVNAEVESYEWDNVFEFGQFFYGLEFGYNWRRSRADFDHVHLLLFYADEKDTQPPVFPNEAGGGFKLAGSKQWDRLVGFGSYTYNTAEGGPFGVALANNSVNAGIAVLRPLNIGGEIGVGATWAEPIDGVTLAGIPQRQPMKDQYGVELYWKILLTPDLWITPGVQFVVNPTFNPSTDSVVIPQFKLRLFL